MAAGLDVATAIIGVLNQAFALGKVLNDTIQDYRNAPAEIGQMASELNVYCELMIPLTEHMKMGSVKYSPAFQQSVETLVKNVSYHG